MTTQNEEDYGAYDAVVEDLDALEQAIEDVCDTYTIDSIRRRKEAIRKK
jgi:hypothetical protein